MFWLFWQLVGVVLGLFAIALITLALKNIVSAIWKYREAILWSLAAMLILCGAVLSGELRLDVIACGVMLGFFAVGVATDRRRKRTVSSAGGPRGGGSIQG